MFDGGPLDSFKRCPKVCYNRWGIHVPTKHILTLAPKHSICFILNLKRGEVYAEKVRYLPDSRTCEMRGSKSLSYQY